MIALVEGAERQKTPNEIALTILLVGLTIIFLIAVGTIPRFASYAGGADAGGDAGGAADHADPDDHRGAAVGDRHRRAWTGWCASTCSPSRAARSRRRATSTCCCSTRPARSPIGDRQASEFRPVGGVPSAELAEAALFASLADETPEGRSIVVLARESSTSA